MKNDKKVCKTEAELVEAIQCVVDAGMVLKEVGDLSHLDKDSSNTHIEYDVKFTHSNELYLTNMKKKIKVKTFLKRLLELADTYTWEDLIDIHKLTEDERGEVQTMIAGIQNDLGEMDEILDKFNLELKG